MIGYTNKVLGTLQAYICNSRPRRFGKSITANMLAAYYSRGCDSEKMFSELEAGKLPDFKKHLNQYDVIHLDIQWCMMDAGSAETTVKYINEHLIAFVIKEKSNVVQARKILDFLREQVEKYV